MVDEAHERTTNTDMLLALLKKLIQQRKHLKLVIMSATINLEKFCQYFAGIDWVRLFVENKPKGNILVFMTSVPEIERNGTALRRDIPALKGAPDALCSSQICTGLGNWWFRQSDVHCLSLCRLALCCRLRPTEAIHLQPPSGNDHARDGSNLASLCTTCQKD
ncbi:hypothetical protein FOXB_11337 [Fusarium oxysporum f. sp. conglutinans Fo5176]|uniref:Helicase ATP-binding domain-containing protein n=1 Tax=Fusarium oxysporum (strain Fo5176) TaxID=660025 RepID=F9FY55_FUSOF|nr:hypothetical protein FOXB_11337 [Fusarium oxysporum f. sp. conglutinans Fo5176]